MVTHNFNKLLPFLFNMDTLVSDQSSPMTYTSRFCVAMLAVFATYNPSEAALIVLSMGLLDHLLIPLAGTLQHPTLLYCSPQLRLQPPRLHEEGI